MSVPITFAYAAFTVLLYLKVKFVPSEIIYVISSYVLIILIAPACTMLIYLLVCSLTPKGRKIFNDFKFSQSTEVEKYKKEAEGKFASKKEVDKKMKEKLTSINERLENIETAMGIGGTRDRKTLLNSKAKKEGKKKSG
jgi:hypothetical protein